MQEKYKQISYEISEFIKINISKAKKSSAVFGLSGGIDSAVIAFLCKNAIGSDKCHAIIMPHKNITPNDETTDAVKIAESLEIKYTICEVDSILEEFKIKSKVDGNKISDGNLLARIRASILYYYSNTKDSLVVGTDDKSEYLIGYFTKYGDGASDILPIRDLYKTEVQKMGEYLGVPSNIVNKLPGAYLWQGHNAQNEIGVGYEIIDMVLKGLVDDDLKADQICDKFKIDIQIVNKITQMCESSSHKRELQPFCDLSHFK